MRLFAGAWVLGFAIALLLVMLRAISWRPLQLVVASFRRIPPQCADRGADHGVVLRHAADPAGRPAPVDQPWGDTEFLFGLIALSLNVSGFMSEDIRAGLRAIPGTQAEAARSVGLSAWGALRCVMLPQAIRIAVPPLINRSLILFKDTSLAMVIGVGELTYQVKAIENQTFRSFEVFAVSTGLYLAASLALMGLGAWFGRRYPPAFRR